MRAWVLLVLLALLSGAALAHNPCRARCRRQAHMCKDRCRARFPYDWTARHRCFEGCRGREAQCRLRCPY